MKSNLPENWSEVKFGNPQYFTILSSGINKFKGGKKYLSTESIQGTKINKIEGVITFNDKPSRANMQPVLNSVWFAKMQGTVKVYSFDEKNSEEINEYILSTGFSGIKVNHKLISPKYLRLILLSNDFNEIKNKLSTGSTQRGINNQSIKTISLIIPPLPTQQKIVSILERVEQAKEMRKEADGLTKDFLKSVFVMMFGNPIKNTKEWPLKKFQDIIKLRRGFDLPVQDRAKGKYKLLASNGIIDSINKFKVIGPGLVTGRSGTIGKVNYTEENYWPLNTTLYSEDLHGNNPLYLLYFLEIYKLKRFVRGTGVPTLNRNLFHNEMIIYPPLSLQQKFASIVKKVEQIKEQQKHSKEQVDNLFNALMQKAFKGELIC